MNLLEPLDAAMITAELFSDPLHVAALLILAPPAMAGSGYVDKLFEQALTDTAQMDPCFRRHPRIGLDTAGLWVWQPDESIDMRGHLERRTLPPGAGPDALWQLVSELHSAPLVRTRPMWIAYLIDGLGDGRFALYLKVHHTVIDGVAGMKKIGHALSADPDHLLSPPFYASERRRSAARATSHKTIPNPLRLARTVLHDIASGVDLAGQVIAGEISTVASIFGVGQTMPPFGAPYTRFNGRIDRERAFVGCSLPKVRVRAIQEAARVTGNDVLTAVIGAVLREWLIAHAELPDRSLVALCPITVRGREGSERPAEDNRGNLFGLELCPLGTHLSDPAERLGYIHRAMSRAKRQVARSGANVTMFLRAPSIGATVLLPTMPFAPRLRRGYNVSISNVPGPRSEMYWHGAHLEEIYPVSTAISGQALNVTTCSYADRVLFGYVSGRHVMPDIETVPTLTERALEDLENAIAKRGRRS